MKVYTMYILAKLKLVAAFKPTYERIAAVLLLSGIAMLIGAFTLISGLPLLVVMKGYVMYGLMTVGIGGALLFIAALIKAPFEL